MLGEWTLLGLGSSTEGNLFGGSMRLAADPLPQQNREPVTCIQSGHRDHSIEAAPPLRCPGSTGSWLRELWANRHLSPHTGRTTAALCYRLSTSSRHGRQRESRCPGVSKSGPPTHGTENNSWVQAADEESFWPQEQGHPHQPPRHTLCAVRRQGRGLCDLSRRHRAHAAQVPGDDRVSHRTRIPGCNGQACS